MVSAARIVCLCKVHGFERYLFNITKNRDSLIEQNCLLRGVINAIFCSYIFLNILVNSFPSTKTQTQKFKFTFLIVFGTSNGLIVGMCSHSINII